MNSPTFLFAGGGSGGHLFPGIAVAQQLRERFPDCRILFVRAGRDIEQRVMSLYHFEHQSLPGDFSAAQSNPIRLLWEYRKARKCAARAIRDARPDVVIGMAGRASIPVVAAAAWKRIPIVLLEPNIVAGRTLSLLAKMATKICLSFAETRVKYPGKCVVTGNPMRPEIVDMYDEPVPSDPRTLLILGGSQGASAVNHIMIDVYRRLRTELADWHIVHQTGPHDVMLVHNCLQNELGLSKGHVGSFFQEVASEYGRASIVVSRAGATTLAELACVGRPTIIVPYPNSVGDHQVANARFYEQPGAARVVLQNDESANVMTSQLLELLTSDAKREALATRIRTLARPYAARDTAAVISDCL